jgi:hypothetical protein
MALEKVIRRMVWLPLPPPVSPVLKMAEDDGKGQVSQVELEVPSEPRKLQVAKAELHMPLKDPELGQGW